MPMYSAYDPSKRGVAPFGYLGIKACSRLPQDFRSVPRPSSPSSAKASTRCPSHTQTQDPVTPKHDHIQSLAQDPSNRRQNLSSDPINSHTHIHTLNHAPSEPHGFVRDNIGLRTKLPCRRQLTSRSPPTPESSRTPQGTQQNLIHNYQRTSRLDDNRQD